MAATRKRQAMMIQRRCDIQALTLSFSEGDPRQVQPGKLLRRKESTEKAGRLSEIMRPPGSSRSINGFEASPPKFNPEEAPLLLAKSSGGTQDSTNIPQNLSLFPVSVHSTW